MDETGHQWRIKFSQVDWVKTAEANGIPLANPDAVNHIGPVVTEEEMRRTWKARPLDKWMISSILVPARSGPRSSSPQVRAVRGLRLEKRPLLDGRERLGQGERCPHL